MARPRRKLVAVEQPVQYERGPDGYALRGEVERFAQTLTDKFLACRELGHNWMPRTAVLTKDNHYDRVLRCSRCRTERHQTISRKGEILTSQYHYRQGYQAQGLGRVVGDGRAALRLESIFRTMPNGGSKARSTTRRSA